jgi:hypothetical protein
MAQAWIVLTHLGIYALNGALFAAYQLWWNLEKVVTLGVMALTIAYFDREVQHRATFTPRRYSREGSASVRPSRVAQGMTVVTAALWFTAAFVTEPPVPVIGTTMWLAMVAGLLVVPQEREAILWRCKSTILIYALAAIGFRFYLWQVDALSPEDWAHLVGSTGDAQAIIAQNRGMFATVASWFLWFLAPLGYLSLLVQRFTVNPMAMVSPFRSAADILRDVRTWGER